MKHFAYINADGVVISTGSCADGTQLSAVDGLTPVVLSGPLPPGQWKWVSGPLQAYTPSPPPPPLLADAQSAQWNLIKQAREAAFDAPLTTPYGVFDSDAVSRGRITDAVLMAQTLASMSQPVAIDFTLADNSVVTLDASQMVTVGLLLGAKIQAAFGTGRTLRAAIYAASTVSEVEAIHWP